jgi:SagB-type dehydrogenase family enzyme
MRLVRSPNVVAYWRGSQFCLEEFVRRRRIAAVPFAVDLLAEFDTPRSSRSVARAFLTYTPASVEREIGRLAKLGFLVPASDRAARRDVAVQWRGSFPAAHFHFAARDVSYVTDPVKLTRHFRRRLAEGSQPPLFKNYPGRLRFPLPDDAPPEHCPSLRSALELRRTVREFSGRPVPFRSFASVLRWTWGQTGWLDAGMLGKLIAKTSPSAGARHPIECYVLAWSVVGLPAGLYHYNVREDCLERLRRGDLRGEAVRLAAGQTWIRQAAFLCVMTAVAERLFWKYSSDDSYRLLFLDAGHLAQTFTLLATAKGLGAFTTASMKESRIETLLGLDGVREFPVYLCGAGVARSGRRDGHSPRKRAIGAAARASRRRP